jgi:hypothetical protein
LNFPHVEPHCHALIEKDIMAARDAWPAEARDAVQLRRRLDSDFLCYCNHDGLYADFHSLGHLFITGLARAGVSLKKWPKPWPGIRTSA